MKVNVNGIGVILPPDVKVDSPTATVQTLDSSPLENWFSSAEYLEGKGYRYMPIPAQIVLAAARGATKSAPTDGGHDRTLWMGSSTAAATIHDVLMDQSVVKGSAGIGPASAPYFSVNLIASRIAQENQTFGGSTTYTTPGVAGIDALAGALISLRQGSSKEAFVCVVEGGNTSSTGALSFILASSDVKESSSNVTARSSSVTADISVKRGFITDFGAKQYVALLKQAEENSSETPTSNPTILVVPVNTSDQVIAEIKDQAAEQGLLDTQIVRSEHSLPIFAALASSLTLQQPIISVVVDKHGHHAFVTTGQFTQ